MKKFALVLGVLVGLCVLLVAFLPRLLSISSVHQFVLGKVNQRIPGKVFVHDFSASWMHGLELKDVEVWDEAGRKVASCQKILCQKSLVSFLTDPNNMGHVRLEAPAIYFIDDGDKKGFSIERVFQEGEKKHKSSGKHTHKKGASSHEKAAPKVAPEIAPISMDLAISDGTVSIEQQAGADVQIRDLQLTLDMKKGDSLRAKILGTVVDVKAPGHTGSFTVDVDAEKLKASPEDVCIKAKADFRGVPCRIADRFARDKMATQALGNNVDITCAYVRSAGTTDVEIDVTSPRFTAHGKIREGVDFVEIPEAVSFRWTPEPACIDRLIAASASDSDYAFPADMRAKEGVMISGSIEPVKAKMVRPGDLLPVPVHLSIGLDSPIVLTSSTWKESLSITLDTHIRLPSTAAAGDIGAHLALSMGSEQATCSAHMEGLSRKRDGEATFTIAASGAWPKLFTSVLRPKGRFASIDKILGPTLESKIQGALNNLEAPTRVTCSGSLNSETGNSVAFDLDMKRDLESGVLTLEKPGTLSCTVMPACIHLLAEAKEKLPLNSPAELHLVCEKLHLPFSSNDGEKATLYQLLDGTECSLSGGLGTISLSKCKGSEESVALPPLLFNADLVGAKRELVFEVASDKTAKSPTELHITGHAANLWNDEAITLSEADLHLDMHLEEFPLDLLSLYSNRSEKKERNQVEMLIALFGDTVHADVKADIAAGAESGSLQAMLSSPHTEGSVQGSFEKGIFHLSAPLKATCEITKKAGKLIFKDANPLFASGVRSTHPITLVVDQKGFACPIFPFSLQGITADRVTIDPGVLIVKNGGVVRGLLTMMKARQAAAEDEVELWCTPLYFSMKDGVLNCQRADALLANTIQVATWGKVNLARDQLDMVLGISKESIQNVFGAGVKGSMLQIPVRGSTAAPEIDTTLASAKLGAVGLQGHGKKKTAILGTLIEAAASLGDGDKAIPPPTTQPFPWEGKVQ